jgi:hypothetical protein
MPVDQAMVLDAIPGLTITKNEHHLSSSEGNGFLHEYDSNPAAENRPDIRTSDPLITQGLPDVSCTLPIGTILNPDLKSHQPQDVMTYYENPGRPDGALLRPPSLVRFFLLGRFFLVALLRDTTMSRCSQQQT